MTDFISDIANFPFMQRAIGAALLVAVIGGVVGTYIVTRRLVFLTGGITHSSFGGIGIAYYMGWNPIGGAMVFAILSALGIELMTRRSGRIREDSAIGILWSVGMAIGIIYVFLTPGYAPNLLSFLFGNILLVTSSAIVYLAIFCGILLLVFAIFHRPVLATAMDREYAATQCLPVRAINMTMMIIVAVAIVLSIKVAGIVLLVSIMTLPAVTANQLSQQYSTITILATIISAVGIVLGIFISNSASVNLPAGAASVVIYAIMFALARIYREVAVAIERRNQSASAA